MARDGSSRAKEVVHGLGPRKLPRAEKVVVGPELRGFRHRPELGSIRRRERKAKYVEANWSLVFTVGDGFINTEQGKIGRILK